MSEKLQKVLARAGLGSRREIETWISAGRVSINGKIATLGERVEPLDKVRVDGHVIYSDRLFPERRRVIVYHKPVGEVCSRSDLEGRPTVFEQLPSLRSGRWISVGRLDLNTSGLLLLTSDGELANRLMHPSSQIEREYAVRVLGEVAPEVLQKLRKGVTLEDGPAHFERIVEGGGQGANRWYHVVLKEGRNREVRRLWESQGVTVSRLMRVRFGPVSLPKYLRPGKWEELKDPALSNLLAQAGLQTAESAPSPSKPRRAGAAKQRPATSTGRRTIPRRKRG